MNGFLAFLRDLLNGQNVTLFGGSLISGELLKFSESHGLIPEDGPNSEPLVIDNNW